MVGTKFYKPVEDWTEYTQAAAWCNENPGHHMEDKGEYYEVVAEPLPSFEDLKAAKRTEIAAARYDYESAGVVFHDVRVTTDREDQAMITAVALSAVVDPAYSTVWKGADGYLNLAAVDVLTLARIVGAHVETAFGEEKRLVEQIDAAQTEEELASIVWTLT